MVWEACIRDTRGIRDDRDDRDIRENMDHIAKMSSLRLAGERLFQFLIGTPRHAHRMRGLDFKIHFEFGSAYNDRTVQQSYPRVNRRRS